jgi:abequosyltransferase
MPEISMYVGVSAKGAVDDGQPLLSVCIGTRNRGRYLGLTLDNILEQCGGAVEVVVVDGASTDNTAEVVRQRAVEWPNLRYFPQTINSGVDGDFDKAVEFAKGRYCWLMSDDDLFAPGAVARVIRACRQAPDAVIVDAEVRTSDLTEILAPHRLTFRGERHYSEAESEQLFIDCGLHLTYIGGLVVRRELWLKRKRKPYFGSEFIHVGVLFQAPLPGGAIVIGEPLVHIRYGVGNWTSRSFQVWMFKWPALIWSFDWLAKSARAAVSRRRPWQSPVGLMLYRAKGWYSWQEFTQLVLPQAGSIWRAWLPGAIALLPGRFLNLAALTYIWLRRRNRHVIVYDLKRSRYFVGRLSRG